MWVFRRLAFAGNAQAELSRQVAAQEANLKPDCHAKEQQGGHAQGHGGKVTQAEAHFLQGLQAHFGEFLLIGGHG